MKFFFCVLALMALTVVSAAAPAEFLKPAQVDSMEKTKFLFQDYCGSDASGSDGGDCDLIDVGSVVVSDVTATTGTVSFTPDEAYDVAYYFLIVPADCVAPSKEDIVDGLTGCGGADVSTTTGTADFGGLTAGSVYTIYGTAVDAENTIYQAQNLGTVYTGPAVSLSYNYAGASFTGSVAHDDEDLSFEICFVESCGVIFPQCQSRFGRDTLDESALIFDGDFTLDKDALWRSNSDAYCFGAAAQACEFPILSQNNIACTAVEDPSDCSGEIVVELQGAAVALQVANPARSNVERVFVKALNADGDCVAISDAEVVYTDAAAPVVFAVDVDASDNEVTVVTSSNVAGATCTVAVVETTVEAVSDDNGESVAAVSGLDANTEYTVTVQCTAGDATSDVYEVGFITTDTTDPVVTLGVVTPTFDGVIFDVTVTDAASDVEYFCSLDYGDYEECTGSYSVASGATYTVSILAEDASNNFAEVSFEFTPLVPDPNTESFGVTYDATIDGDVAYGAEADLSGNFVAAVDVVASGSPESATLTFFAIDAEEGTEFTITALTAPWLEASVTEECAAGLSGGCFAGNEWVIGDNVDGDYSSTATVTNGVLVFDVTADIVAILAGDLENNGWYITSDTTGTFSSSEGPNGGELTIDYGSSETASVASICENQTGEVACDSGVINIVSANYGRTDGHTCSTGWATRHLSNIACSASSSLYETAAECNGKSSCTLTPNNAKYGDPCRGTYKYLSLSYQCVVDFTQDWCADFAETDQVAKCWNGAVGAVYVCQDGWQGSDCTEEVPAPGPLDGIVAHYSFDDESTDDNENDNHAVADDGVGYGAGVTGRAAFFSEGKAVAPDSDSFATLDGDFTITAWINADTESQGKHSAVYVGQNCFAGGERDGVAIYISTDSKYSTGARISARLERPNGRQTLEMAYPNDGAFHFVAVVFTEGVQTLYVDTESVEVVNKATAGPVSLSADGFHLGGDGHDNYQAYGLLDEVRIFNIAKSAEDISAILTFDGSITEVTDATAPVVTDETPVDAVVLDVPVVGCADGTVEGFEGFESIAACQGAFSTPGTLSVESINRPLYLRTSALSVGSGDK